MEKPLFGSRIRLRHINCFVSVAQEHSLGKAADKLSLSQPALSKTLAELEDILGVRLFERGRQGAQLTREGEAFLTHAVSVLEALEAGARAVGMQQVSGTESIYLGALPTVAPDLLPLALEDFRRIHPHIKIVIRTAANAALLETLKGGEIDLVLGRMSDPEAMLGLSFELLYVEPLVLAARPGHPLAASARVSLSEVVGYPLVVSARGTIPRHNTDNFLQSRGIALPDNCIETLSVSVGRVITRHSDSIWFVPVGAVRDDLDSGNLIRLALPTTGTEEPVGLLHRSEGKLPSAVADFMQILRELAAKRHRSS